MPDINISPEQKEILDAGRGFAALENSAAYRRLMDYIGAYAGNARDLATSAMRDSSVSTESYMRLSLRRDVAEELQNEIKSWVAAIKQQALDLAEQLKQESE
jgi:hypothetical protein